MSLGFLTVIQNFLDPTTLPVEIVERKGVGHPDSLADALANEVSITFSKYCLNRFGIVLHHNVDKLYIGGGHFKTDFGLCERLQPIQVLTNGRISNRFGDEQIDVVSLQREAIERYLFRVLPSLGKDDIVVVPNATQFHRNEYRFAPRNRGDVPDAISPWANDTSLCVSHWPPTITESLAYRFERYFWNVEEGFAVPRFANIGQDIKVFVLREGKRIEVLLSVPTLCRHTKSFSQYPRADKVL
jgi:S-adenosylmethionine synthetase